MVLVDVKFNRTYYQGVLRMTDYFVSNTYRFIANGESDMYDLLEMAERYNSNEHLNQQIEIILGLYQKEVAVEISKYRGVAGQGECWLKFCKLIQEWTDAWMEVVQRKPELGIFCGNQTVRNYLIFVK